MKRVGLFIWFLFSINWSQSQTLSSNELTKDTIRLNEYLKTSKRLSIEGKYDSLWPMTQKGFGICFTWKVNTFYPELFKNYGLYYKYRGEYKKALVMLNKGVVWAKRNHNNDLLQQLNAVKAATYFDDYISSGEPKTRLTLLQQLYENIRLSKILKSSKYLYSTYWVFTSLYEIHGHGDSTYYSLLKNHVKYYPVTSNYRSSYTYQFAIFKLCIYEKKRNQARALFFELFNRFKSTGQTNDRLLATLYIMLDICVRNEEWELADIIQQKLVEIPKKSYDVFDLKNFALLAVYKKDALQAQRFYNLLREAKIQPYSFYYQRSKLYHLIQTKRQLAELKKDYKTSYEALQEEILFKEKFKKELAYFELDIVQEQVKSDLLLQEYYRKIELKKEEVRKAELENRSQLKLFLIIVAFLAGIIAIFLYQFLKIRKQANELMALTTNQNLLFGIIGHDLRGPVVSLHSVLHRLLNAPTLTESQLKSSISQRFPHLNALLLTVDNLLYWARSQQKDFRTSAKVVVLNDIIEEVIELLVINAEVKNISIVSSLPETSCCFMDENHLKIILRNVLQNAIKFSPEGGKIRISGEVAGSLIEVTILDNGPGLTKTQESKEKGTGLGLSLVQSLVKRNNGFFAIGEVSEGGTKVSLKFKAA